MVIAQGHTTDVDGERSGVRHVSFPPRGRRAPDRIDPWAVPASILGARDEWGSPSTAQPIGRASRRASSQEAISAMTSACSGSL